MTIDCFLSYSLSVFDLINLLMASQIIVEEAILREGSRGSRYRIDHLYTTETFINQRAKWGSTDKII